MGITCEIAERTPGTTGVEGGPGRPAASDYDSTASPARARPNLVYHAASAVHTRPEPAPGSGFNRSVPKP